MASNENRGLATRECFISVGSRGAWLTAPASTMPIGGQGWGAISQYTNGLYGIIGSKYEGKAYTFNWPFLRGANAFSVINMFSRAAGKPVFYLDPFSNDNILSPLAGTPYMLAETDSPVAFDEKATTLAQSLAIGSEPWNALSFTGTAPTDGNSHVYKERIVIPADKKLLVVADGTNTGAVVKIDGTAVGATPVAITADSLNNKTVYLTIDGGQSAVAIVNWVRAAILPSSSTDTISGFAEPRGGGNLQVSPQTFAVTGMTAATQDYAITIDLREVWAWA